MGKTYVVFQLDTEDFINRVTDEILIELAKIFNKHGIRVTFAIVGEKARVFEKRMRTDVIRFLKEHDVAYQSNLHSVHPVITEYVNGLGWNEGVKEVIKRESEGIVDIAKIFGKRPKAFIQPGGSWAPQTVYAMRRMGIKVYANGIFKGGPFWYCGALGVRYTIHFREDIAHLDNYLERVKEEFKAQYSNLKEKGGIIIILFHPCTLVTKEFWDTLNFAKGVNSSKITYSSLYPEEEVKAKLRNLDKLIQFIKEHDVEFVTLSELYDLFEYSSKASFTMEEVKSIAEHFAEELKYFKLKGRYVSPAEGFYVLSSLLNSYYLNGKLPEVVKCIDILGPTQRPMALDGKVVLPLLEFLKKVCEVKLYIDAVNTIPHEVEIKGRKAGPGDFMKAMASVCLKLIEGDYISEVTVEPFRQVPELDFDLEERVKRGWKWGIFPEGFEAPSVLELTILQSWTLKPAVLGP